MKMFHLLAATLMLGAVLARPCEAQNKDRRTRRYQNVDFNINEKQMTTLLQALKNHPNRSLRDLASGILKDGIKKVTGAHSGGKGGGGRPADPEQHCTVKTTKDDNYHVYLKQKSGKWMITKITK
jgi:hypothetical protein